MVIPQKNMKNNNYYIISMNCGQCGFHYEARINKPKGSWASAKCECCGDMLGLMDWRIMDRIKAVTTFEAISIYIKSIKTGGK